MTSADTQAVVTPTDSRNGEAGRLCVQRLVTPPNPYHEQDGIRIFCGDNRQIVPLLGDYDLMLTDPPYGVGVSQRGKVGTSKRGKVSEYTKEEWDSAAPPKWMIDMAREKSQWQIIFGGNLMELPPAKCWLVWHKDNTGVYSPLEMAWTNLDQTNDFLRYRWNGMIQENMTEKEVRWHPTQKPVPVMEWCIGHTEAKTILDPWMGSGTTLIAARAKGLRADGIEINEQYCAAAVARLSQGVLLAV